MSDRHQIGTRMFVSLNYLLALLLLYFQVCDNLEHFVCVLNNVGSEAEDECKLPTQTTIPVSNVR